MSNLPNHDRPLDASHCSLCARYHSDARYRQFVDAPPGPPPAKAAQRQSTPAKPRRPDCVHLGLPVLNQPKCGCGEKLRKCDEFGVCRVSVAKDGVACCRTCEKYEAT